MPISSQTQLAAALNKLKYDAVAASAQQHAIFLHADEQPLRDLLNDMRHHQIVAHASIYHDARIGQWCLDVGDRLALEKLRDISVDAAIAAIGPKIPGAHVSGPSTRGGYGASSMAMAAGSAPARLTLAQERIIKKLSQYDWVAHGSGGVEYDPSRSFRSSNNIITDLKALEVPVGCYGECDSQTSPGIKAAYITDAGIKFLTSPPRNFPDPRMKATAVAITSIGSSAIAELNTTNKDGTDYYPFKLGPNNDMEFDNSRLGVGADMLRIIRGHLHDAGASGAYIDDGKLIVPKAEIATLAGNGMRAAGNFQQKIAAVGVAKA